MKTIKMVGGQGISLSFKGQQININQWEQAEVDDKVAKFLLKIQKNNIHGNNVLKCVEVGTYEDTYWTNLITLQMAVEGADPYLWSIEPEE
jgi:hypothetical protein